MKLLIPLLLVLISCMSFILAAFVPQTFDSVDLVLNGSYTAQDFDDIDLILGVGPIDSCSCPNLNNDWEIDLTDSCVIVDNCDIGTGDITFINTGVATFNAIIQAQNMDSPPNNGILFIDSNARVLIG